MQESEQWCVPKQFHYIYLNLIRFPLLSHLHAFAALIIQSQTIYDEFNVARFVVKPCKADGKETVGDCPVHRIDAEALRNSIQSIEVMNSKSADVQSENEYLNSSYNWKNLQTD